MSCSVCEMTRLVYAKFAALGKPINTTAREIAGRAAQCATPAEAKRFIDAEIARLSQ